MQHSLTNHEEGKLNNIEDALYKLENGTYGICDICHQNIDKDRLDILPETNLCSNCARNWSATSGNVSLPSKKA